MKVYLAGPIFCYGDYLRNKEWADKIRAAIPNVDLYSPVENSDINGVEGKKKFAGSQEIVDADMARLSNTDVLVACIDGDCLPAGTSCEIGIMYDKIMHGEHRHMIGICTDTRQCALTHSEAKDIGGAKRLGEQQYSYQNIFVTGCLWKCGGLVYSIDEVIDYLKKVEEELNVQGECVNDL